MPLMMSKLWAALRSAGVPEEEAMEAAEEAARADWVATKDDINLLRLEVKADIEVVNGRVNLLTWMVGFALALLVPIALKLLFPH
jgi:hypothetical protein